LKIDITEVREWLNRYAATLAHGSASDIAAYWEIPAHLFTESEDITFETAFKVEAHASHEQLYYETTGVHYVIPGVEQYDELGPDLVALQVTWTNMDYDDNYIGSDRANYVLHRDGEGSLRIRTATPRKKLD